MGHSIALLRLEKWAQESCAHSSIFCYVIWLSSHQDKILAVLVKKKQNQNQKRYPKFGRPTYMIEIVTKK